MGILDKIRKNTKSKFTSVLEESMFFNNLTSVKTHIPCLNIALAGDVDGGIGAGGTLQIAGPSKHFKSKIALELVSAYMKKYDDAACLFYDSEFGSPLKYFKASGIDVGRVLHTPVTDIEGLKFDIMGQLEHLDRDDRVIILIDSIGNLASKKEVEDALNDKSVADMTRAKQLKSLFRMITPHLALKNITLVAINHTYKEMALYPKDIVGGGTGSYYSSNDIWIVSRTQDKVGTEVAGYTFTINIEKSRAVREKSKIPLSVTFDGGIDKWSGLLDLAVEANLIVKSGGWYQAIDFESGEVNDKKLRASDLDDVWYESLLAYEPFKQFVKEKYQLVTD